MNFGRRAVENTDFVLYCLDIVFKIQAHLMLSPRTSSFAQCKKVNHGNVQIFLRKSSPSWKNNMQENDLEGTSVQNLHKI